MVDYEPLNSRYISNLHRDRKALSYLYKRGFSLKTIKRYELGLSLSTKHEISSKVVEEAGLVYQKENGSLGAVFNNRIMIPIRNTDGVICGYTGRTLLNYDGLAKYKNSKESKFFNKSSILYNLHSIESNDSVIIFEGHLNVLAFDQTVLGEFGKFPHPVAKGGTALTPQHVEALKDKGVKSVFICNDGDKAGREATLKDIKLLKDDFLVWVITMPKNKDMADFINNYDEVERLVFFESVLHDEYIRRLAYKYKRVKQHRIKHRLPSNDSLYLEEMKKLYENVTHFYIGKEFVDNGANRKCEIVKVDDANQVLHMYFPQHNEFKGVVQSVTFSYFEYLLNIGVFKEIEA